MKGKIFEAKKKTKKLILLTPVIFLGIYFTTFYIFVSLEDKPILNSYLTQLQIISSIISTVVTFIIFRILYFIFWNKIKKRFECLKNKRTIFHYNLCLKLMENKKYDKALYFYNKIFKNSEQPLASILRVALKVHNNETLSDEYIEHFKKI